MKESLFPLRSLATLAKDGYVLKDAEIERLGQGLLDLADAAQWHLDVTAGMPHPAVREAWETLDDAISRLDAEPAPVTVSSGIDFGACPEHGRPPAGLQACDRCERPLVKP